MAGTGDTVVKKCMFCGVDVSNAPRLKDEQGRYVCRPCAEKKMPKAQNKPGAAPVAAATKAAGKQPAASAPDAKSEVAAYELANGPMDLADIAKSVEGSVLNAKPCANCGGFIPAGGKVCTSCGFNVETGKAVKTRIEKAVGTPGEKKGKRGGGGIHLSAGAFAMIIIGVMLALFAGSLAYPPMILAFYILFLLFSLAYTIMLIVAPFQDGDSGWGIVAIASFFVPFISLAMIYYIFVVSERASLKILFLTQILAIVLFVMAIVIVGPDALNELRGGE